jgi:hypothetical protein
MFSSIHCNIIFYVLLTLHLYINLWMKPTWCTIFSVYFVRFIYNLYIFRTSLSPSSGFIWHQVSVTYSYYSWWWTWRGLKHVQVINKIDETYWEYCATSWFHLQDHFNILTSLPQKYLCFYGCSIYIYIYIYIYSCCRSQMTTGPNTASRLLSSFVW